MLNRTLVLALVCASALFSQTRRPLKLDDLARETLGNQKTGNGLEIVQWWREGRKEEVCKYCENDVQLLVDLVEFARSKKYVVVNARQQVRPVAWHIVKTRVGERGSHRVAVRPSGQPQQAGHAEVPIHGVGLAAVVQCHGAKDISPAS